MIPCWFEILFWSAAFLGSGFYGWCAVEIFLPLEVTLQTADLRKHKEKCSWRVHQRWLNFAGSMVGWWCLWVVGVKVWPFWPFVIASESLTWGDAGLAFVAFLGVTGFIPYAATTLIVTAYGTVAKLAGIGKD
jgi:hypothetical protein